ncbi:nuclear transport factor 2 family protein [Halomarina ordinaria]|uniref:Nuclear transport factor 2 family protein n=1 Tax=Halomarina ordinaria TaxID=3033939 RepID=A0ABD5UAJ9_9EURY|nr:nuclear transport factor 2 family protein [Halomarina sp. PSRA2]
MDPADLAREYYRAIDEGDYDALAAVLAPGFVHDRPDRVLDGRAAFVRFMREERPDPDTTHDIDALLVSEDGAGVVCEGRLRRADGEVWFRFADVFAVEDGALSHLRTYTH